MSDDFSTYMKKVRAMLNVAQEQAEQIVKVWQLRIMTRVVIDTPGPGNQYPLTEYIATGRLRAGWNFGPQAPASVPLMGISGRVDGEDNPAATISTLGIQISASGMLPVSYLWNEVGYGLYVHEGLGNHEHIGPRPWVQLAADSAQDLLDQARVQVMGGGGGGD